MQVLSRHSAQKQNAQRPGKRTQLARRRSRSKWSITILCLLPSLILFGIFVLLPVVQGGYYSLFNWNGLGPLDHFIGLKNYTLLLQDPVFLGTLRTNLTIALLSLFIQLPISLFLAILIRQRAPGSTFFRLVFFLPYVLSEVIAGILWGFIYNGSTGLLVNMLKVINPAATPPAFLADTHTVLYAIFVAMCWKYFGFHLILYLAGLQNIPQELPEAARTDGASRWQVLRYITLPMLGSTIRLTIFLSMLGSLQYFDLIYVMSDGGPVYASETMATYLVHRGITIFELGYGSAVGMVLFVICFIFALAYQRWVMRQDLTGTAQ